MVNLMGRELIKEEKELRSEWMKMVYEIKRCRDKKIETKEGTHGNAVSRISGDGG